MNAVNTRKHVVLSLFAAVIFAAFGMNAAAQQPQSGQQSTQPAKPSSQQSAKASTSAPPPVAGIVPLGVTRIEQDLVTPGYRASKLLKQTVYNDQNQKIGKIEDLVIAPDGTLSVAVVDVGGFLGVAKHRVAIPVKQFTQMQPKVILPSATKEALKQLPEFVPA
jgi:sporulation protein YlmC with PRC-barrel domain